MELHLPFSDPEPVVEEVEEPSVLEYAREQGICVDYTTELPRLVDICFSLRDGLPEDSQDPFDHELTSAAAAANNLLKQRLALPKDAAIFLRSTLTAPDLPADYSCPLQELQRLRALKQELPLLRTDAELDMLSFGTRFVPDFADLITRLPSEDVDEENDEGLGWPEKYAMYPAECDKRVRSERLAVSRDAVMVLRSVMRDEFTEEDGRRAMAEALESGRSLTPRHLTPPLLPLSPPSSPYIPSSPANRLPLLPDSSDSVAAEAKALERQIMAKDSLLRLNSGSSDSMLLDIEDLDALFDADEAATPSSDRVPTILKRKVDDLKVEGPLTPPMFSDSPMKKLKSVSFSKMIQIGGTLEPWSDEHRPSTADSPSIMDDLLKEIEPVAREAKRRAENEKLTGADTISRVDVPDMDFALPVAPWQEFSQRKDSKRRSGTTELEAQMRFLQLVKRDDLKSATAWRGVSDLDLNWGWFASPSSTTIKLHEKLHGETEFNKIQAELKTGNIATSSNEVWKREGLRLLDEEEDVEEEEIELGEFGERGDIDALVRKRKLELEEQEETREAHRKHGEGKAIQSKPNLGHLSRQERGGVLHSKSASTNADDPRNTQRTSHSSHVPRLNLVPGNKPAETLKEAPTELMFGGFSASTALHKFMETQGKAIKQPETKSQESTSGAPATQYHASGHKLTGTSGPHMAREPEYGLEHSPRNMHKPTPPFDLPASSIIVSAVLLQRRPLVKEIERLHPKIDLIYRDYTLPHSASTEADIILSPSTGVLLTTLQQIKQRPLPGQTARSPVKDRMATLQERYERLVVMISEGLREESGYSRPEDARDKETLQDLEVFAAQLKGDAMVKYVPGGEQAFARAVVESVEAYGLPLGGKDMQDIKLLPVETTWESFLRRAGLNTFAAQVIIASLKTPTRPQFSSLLSSPTSYAPPRPIESTGLSTFLLMNPADRAKHFQAIMGGRRILDKVSALLDQRWISAAHGFRM